MSCVWPVYQKHWLIIIDAFHPAGTSLNFGLHVWQHWRCLNNMGGVTVYVLQPDTPVFQILPHIPPPPFSRHGLWIQCLRVRLPVFLRCWKDACGPIAHIIRRACCVSSILQGNSWWVVQYWRLYAWWPVTLTGVKLFGRLSFKGRNDLSYRLTTFGTFLMLKKLHTLGLIRWHAVCERNIAGKLLMGCSILEALCLMACHPYRCETWG